MRVPHAALLGSTSSLSPFPSLPHSATDAPRRPFCTFNVCACPAESLFFSCVPRSLSPCTRDVAVKTPPAVKSRPADAPEAEAAARPPRLPPHAPPLRSFSERHTHTHACTPPATARSLHHSFLVVRRVERHLHTRVANSYTHSSTHTRIPTHAQYLEFRGLDSLRFV